MTTALIADAELEVRPTDPVTSEAAKAMQTMQEGVQTGFMDLDKIYVNKSENVRGISSDSYSPESIDEMMCQIEAVGGLQQPITVCRIDLRPETENKPYMLMIGYRRTIALTALAEQDPKWGQKIPVRVVSAKAVATDAATKMAQLIENVGRKDLNQMEIATAIYTILNDKEADFSQKDVARMLGRSEANVSQLMKLNRLPKGVQDLVSSGKLSFSHARLLMERVPETSWQNVATKAAGMMLEEFEDYLDKDFPRANADADEKTTDGTAKTSSQKPAKMLRSTEVTGKFVPFLKQQIEKADGSAKNFTAKDIAQAKLDAINTVLLDQKTALATEIAPYLKQVEEKEAAEKLAEEATKAEEKFFREKVKRVEEILDAPVDPTKPDAERPKLTQAYAQVGKEVFLLSDEQKKALGFTLPATPDAFLQKLSATYQEVIKDRAEARAKKEKAKAEKEAAEKAKAAGTAPAAS